MIIRAKAPLRISFAGGGTDVPPFPEREGGCVLNATIARFAWGSLRPRDDDRINLESVDLGISLSYSVNGEMAFDGQLDLAKAAIQRLGAKNSHGFDVFLHSDAPPGSGLGSSSALMVSLVGLVKEFKNLEPHGLRDCATRLRNRASGFRHPRGTSGPVRGNFWRLQFYRIRQGPSHRQSSTDPSGNNERAGA